MNSYKQEIMFSYSQSSFNNYCHRGRRLVWIQMAVIKTIKSNRNMDGGGEGITPVSNIPQQCSVRDHRNLNKHSQRAEQWEERCTSGWKLKKNWKLLVWGNDNKGGKERERGKNDDEKQFFCLLLWISGTQIWERVTADTGWISSGNFVARSSTHNAQDHSAMVSLYGSSAILDTLQDNHLQYITVSV